MGTGPKPSSADPVAADGHDLTTVLDEHDLVALLALDLPAPELGEIEAVLTEQPGVDRAVVVVRGDRPEDKELVAYMMARGHRANGGELRIHAARMLPAYMVPVAVVVLDSFPLT